MKFIKLSVCGAPCIYPLSALNIEFCSEMQEERGHGSISFHENAKKYTHQLALIPWAIYIKLVEEIECFLGNAEHIYDFPERREVIGEEVQLKEIEDDECPKCENCCPKCGPQGVPVSVYYPLTNNCKMGRQCSNPDCAYMP